tara:strand:- start:3813 stop:4232 length:420 start_codon:yes stop_codon:yes gene_type:complete
MHEHISIQDFVLLVFSVGTPFCICCYCSFRCLNSYLKAIRNAEIQADSQDFESDSESESENGFHREEEILSPRSIRVINKYGHFKPDYSSESTSEEDFTSLSEYSDQEYSDQEYGEILTERQLPESIQRIFHNRNQAYG